MKNYLPFVTTSIFVILLSWSQRTFSQEAFFNDKAFSEPESLGKFEVNIADLLKGMGKTAVSSDSGLANITVVYRDQTRIDVQGLFVIHKGVFRNAHYAVKMRFEFKAIPNSKCYQILARTMVNQRGFIRHSRWMSLSKDDSYFDQIKTRMLNTVFNATINDISYAPC